VSINGKPLRHNTSRRLAFYPFFHNTAFCCDSCLGFPSSPCLSRTGVSIYNQTVGKCKSPTSKKDLPLSPYVASELLDWQQQSTYQEADNWVFASPQAHGRYPYWPAILLTRTVRPAAIRAGIQKRIGWHTFRHTYSTLLVSNGENVKVIQELMRHASKSVHFRHLLPSTKCG
jgi:integrase